MHESSTQAAISLHNAQLYAKVKDSEVYLEHQVKERTQELQAANEQLERLATIDSLTQIANRRRFDQYLSLEWQRNLRAHQPLGLILLDIDYFKLYNDYYGHPAGDECLFRVVQCLETVLTRTSDLLARYGGEEFAVILPNTPLAGVLYVAELMQKAVAELAIPHAMSEIKSCVTISLGAASLIPTLKTCIEDLISQADQALYQAKHQGRNRAIPWSEVQNVEVLN